MFYQFLLVGATGLLVVMSLNGIRLTFIFVKKHLDQF
jgi:hypothetical protein